MTSSRQESPTGSISQVTREVPSDFTSSLHSAVIVCTRRRGGSTSTFSPSLIAKPAAACAGAVARARSVQSESIPTPKLYFARMSLSVIASQSFSGVVLM